MLEADVVLQRARDPRAFELVGQALRQARASMSSGRSGRVPIGLWLGAIGPRAELPILSALALCHESLSVELAAELVEALGPLRATRATSLLLRWLSTESLEPALVERIVNTLAEVGAEDVEDHLVDELRLAESQPLRQRAIVRGMGPCHGLRTTEALVDLLTKSHEDGLTVDLARSLGRMGSAWGWSARADRTHESAIRTLAARALAHAWRNSSVHVQLATERALILVSDPTTAAVIQENMQNAYNENAAARLLSGISRHRAAPASGAAP